MALAKSFCVYGLLDPRTGHLRYVGKASCLRDRAVKHLCPSNLAGSSHRVRWLRQLRQLHLKPVPVVIETFDTEAASLLAEIELIEYFRYLGCNLTNTAPGGIGGYTGPMSAETRAKLSASNRQPKSAEHRARIAESHVGIRPSAATREKSRQAKLGDRNGNAKVTLAMARLIRELLQQGVLQKEIMQEFGISRRTVYDISSGKRWNE